MTEPTFQIKRALFQIRSNSEDPLLEIYLTAEYASTEGDGDVLDALDAGAEAMLALLANRHQTVTGWTITRRYEGVTDQEDITPES